MDICNFLEGRGYVREFQGGNIHVMRRGNIIVSGVDGDLPSEGWWMIGVYHNWDNAEEFPQWDCVDQSADGPNFPKRDFAHCIAEAEKVEARQ